MWGLGALALASGLASTQPVAATSGCAAAGTCNVTVIKDQHKTVHEGPTLSQTVDIEYDLYVPENATSTTPQPGIIHFNGLGGGKNDGAAIATSSFMARHGYVVLAFTSQGNGDTGNGMSGGVLELEAPGI